MLTWPHAQSDWHNHLPQMNEFYVEWVDIISRFQHVIILCFDDAHAKQVKGFLRHLSNYRILLIPTNDTWIRDYGPFWKQSQDSTEILNFQFNAWGNKFPFQLDNQVNLLLQQKLFQHQSWLNVNLILEGGSIEFDGENTIMTTSQCLLNDNRNKLEKSQLEFLLKQNLGVEHILWLDFGHIVGDDTDAHIDTLARFCNPHTIAYVQCTDKHYPSYTELMEMEKQLGGFNRASGQAYDFVPLPHPSLALECGPATYANFIFVNSAIIFPEYGVAEDEDARRQLKQIFPKRQIIGLNSTPLIAQGGSLHCASMQIPAKFSP